MQRMVTNLWLSAGQKANSIYKEAMMNQKARSAIQTLPLVSTTSIPLARSLQSRETRYHFAMMWAKIYSYYRKPLSGQVLTMLSNVLASYSLQQIRDGLNKHLVSARSGRFLPNAADVVRQINHDIDDYSLSAWQTVINAIYQHGVYGSQTIEDITIKTAIHHIGGWRNLCHCSDWELKQMQRHFVETLSSISIANAMS